MIRTLDVAADLRIEVRRRKGRRHVTLVDPATGEKLLIAKDLQDSTINDLNKSIWESLDKIAKDLEADPELGASYGATITCEVYKVGFAALLRLTRKIDDVQEFCSLRIQNSATSPPIIDVVAQEDDHIFFEVMPLLGKANQYYRGDPDAREAAVSVLTGFNAVVRHQVLKEQPVRVNDNPSRVSVRFFQHTGLPGSGLELRQLKDLEKKRSARVSLQYPPRHFRPPPGDPEKELATRLADPWFLDTDIDDGPGTVCHLSCHLKESKGGAVLELRPDGRWAKPTQYRIDMVDVAFHHDDVPIIPPYAKLCFVSACKSAAIDRKLLLSAMDALRELKPESIVGTLGSIPDATAARFALNFYKLITEGWSVGAALWQAKKSLLEAPFYNPLGLLFVSYRGEDVQFALPADSRQRFIPDEVSAILAAPTKGS